jgi:transcriptional regulator with XRE-family HTH domain
MAAIDPNGLAKAMDLAPMTAKQLADRTGMSLTYVCDIVAGRRTLKRNPELRKRIASELGVPQHWIEHQEGAA